MIKYLELTAPELSAFRQVKILSILCSEGDYVEEGDPLFRVKSGENEIDLPSTRDGKIIEMIVGLGENITISTPLLLLETEVEGSTATPPIIPSDEATGSSSQTSIASTQGDSPSQVNAANQAPASPKETKIKKKTPTKNTKKATASKKPTAKKAKDDQQQMLNLSDDSEEPVDSPEQIEANTNAQTSSPMPDSSTIKISVPDIGADSAKVIEILVKVGDQIDQEDPLVTLESDKASMDVPSTHAGEVTAVLVKMDQDVSEGTVLVELTTSASEDQASTSTDKTQAGQEDEEPSADQEPLVDQESSADQEPSTPEQAASAQDPSSEPTAREQSSDDVPTLNNVNVPDIGGDSAKVIEILVKAGDSVEIEDALITLESDKASMEVPSTIAGVIESIAVNLEDEVSEGTLIVTIKGQAADDGQAADSQTSEPAKTPEPKTDSKPEDTSATGSNTPAATTQKSTPSETPSATQGKSHASPSIRRFARELGVDLSKVSASGRKNRVTKDDVKGFVKGIITKPPQAASSAANETGAGIPQIPAQDFRKFGDIEIQPLNRIKKLTATNLHRSWLNVPHVTHNDEANISDLEAFRKQANSEYAAQKRDIKLSPLAFIVKAVVNGLRTYPQFNSSLENGGENLILKKYFNIGSAVETPNGLVVPVIKDADRKSVAEIAQEMNQLAEKARNKKLTMNDMTGACFTVSSLGGIGGTGFTPIVNAPEVAILGVSRSKMQPVWNGSEFEPGMILPLSVSYDHRVIDGAEAARFTRHIAAALEDVRRLTL